MDRSELPAVTVECAEAGAAVAADLFRTALNVETKSDKTDVVTRADREAQAAVVDRITTHDPDPTVYGEEGETETEIPQEGRVWVIDPIDGTSNYVRGNRRWATSVACLVDGEAVAAVNVLPALDDTYVGTPDGVTRNGKSVGVSDRRDPQTFQVAPIVWWDRDRREEYAATTGAIVDRFGDLRRVGSAQAALSMVAAGVIDGVVTNVETNPWDTIAGAAMIRWAGGTVTDLTGEEWHHSSRGLVASNGQAHDELLGAAGEIESQD